MKQAPKMGIPSLSVVNSILSEKIIVESKIDQTPILPYPATSFYSTHTTVLDYHDVLK